MAKATDILSAEETSSMGVSSFVRQCFLEAAERTYGSLVGSEAMLKEIQNFLITYTTSINVQLLVTTEGLPQVAENIFSSTVLRDYVLKLTSNFFARLLEDGQSGVERYEALVLSLAFSLDIHGAPLSAMVGREGRKDQQLDLDEYEAIPEEYSSRLPYANDIAATLCANKWLIMVILICLYHPVIASSITGNDKA